MSSVTKNKGSFSVKAYAGDAKTLLAFNLDKHSAKNLAGFSIQCQSDGQPAYYIQNELQFKSPGDHAQDAKEPPSSINAPIHKFRWLLNCTKRLLSKAHSSSADVYIFGRTYTDGSPGIHDIHMNQGSSGGSLNNCRDAITTTFGRTAPWWLTSASRNAPLTSRRLRSKLFPPIISGIRTRAATRFKIRMPDFWREISSTTNYSPKET
jgi:hypothetical protein